MVLNYAAQNFDVFPSIAEMKRICDRLQADKPPNTSHGKKVYDFTEAEVVEKHPWPNSIIGLLMGFEGRGPSEYGMNQLGISRDEAKYLYDCWKALDWKNEWAMEIISKSKTNAVLVGVKAAV